MTFKTLNLKKFFTAVFYIFTPLVLGFLTSLAIGDLGGFYTGLQRPPLAPPPILFPIAWSILYLLLGISSYLSRTETKALILFYIGLAANYAWVFFFFKFHLVVFSALWLVFMLIIALFNIIEFFKCNKTSGYLFLPYVLWLAFALYLNIGIAILN